MPSFAQKFVRTLIKSLGLKRKLSNLFQTLSLIISTIPVISPYASLLQAIASWLGLAGVTHAAAASTFKIDIHTVAAFFSALVLAAQTVPELAPFAVIIQVVASILALFATTKAVSEKSVEIKKPE